MRWISENEASELTGKDRKTVKRRLEGIAHRAGPHGAREYPSDQALEAIIVGAETVDGEKITTAEAVRRLTIAKEAEIDLKMQVIRQERIPRDDVLVIIDEIQQSTAAILKSCKGKRLDEPKINEILAQLREMPAQLPSAVSAAS